VGGQLLSDGSAVCRSLYVKAPVARMAMGAREQGKEDQEVNGSNCNAREKPFSSEHASGKAVNFHLHISQI
jgi:hypothetical protein